MFTKNDSFIIIDKSSPDLKSHFTLTNDSKNYNEITNSIYDDNENFDDELLK